MLGSIHEGALVHLVAALEEGEGQSIRCSHTVRQTVPGHPYAISSVSWR